MKYKLTSRALKDLKKTYSFYSVLYGKRKSEQIIIDFFDYFSILESQSDFTQMGPVDEQFSSHTFEYRKLFFGYLKITYRVGKSNIYIVRIFDSRQNPKKNI